MSDYTIEGHHLGTVATIVCDLCGRDLGTARLVAEGDGLGGWQWDPATAATRHAPTCPGRDWPNDDTITQHPQEPTQP